MSECRQTPTQTILEHGISVCEYLFDLIGYLKGRPLKKTWRLPQWIDQYKDQLLANLLDDYILMQYTIFHDCGKPYCLKVDDEGRRHFPDHARKSSAIYDALRGDHTISELILHDMDIHTIKADGLDEFCRRSGAISLLLTGLSEVHSNAELFGGIESQSFKQKWNNLDRRGRAICKRLFT